MRYAEGTSVSVRNSEQIVMGADSLTLLAGERLAYAPKLLRVGDVVVGAAGAGVWCDALFVFLRISPPDLLEAWRSALDVMQYMGAFATFANESFGLRRKEEPEDGVRLWPLSALVASPRGLFGIDSSGSVSEFARRAAEGRHREIAIGALEVLLDRGLSPREAVEAAIETTQRVSTVSGEPLSFETVPLDPKRTVA